VKINRLEIIFGPVGYSGQLDMFDGQRAASIELGATECALILNACKYELCSSATYSFDYMNPLQGNDSIITTPQQVPSSEPKAEDDIPF
jgi:hypothetical protein